MELRKKRDEGFLTDAEKIEMFMLDELDQKGDYLVGKYFQDRSSLTEEQLQLLANSLSRYYQQIEGMSGEQAAFQAVTDLLTGNWGYRANNYDYPYLSYDEHKEQYSDAYWKDYWNNLTIDNFLNSRPQDENEKYYNEAVLELALAKQLEWDQKVGRPVMNFLRGGVGLLFNGVDTVQAGYELAEVSKRLANGEELNTEMVLKLVNAGFTFVPVAASTAIPKGPSKGTTGGVITDVDSLLPGNSSQITLPDGNNLTNTPNLSSSWGYNLDKNTVTVYRIEGDANTRLLIDDIGNVAIVDKTKVLYLNFGDPIRAQEFLSKRLIQGLDGATIKQFEVPQSVLTDLRKNAVKESEVKLNPNNPIISDPTKAKDQYGIRPEQLYELQNQIKQGSGKDAYK